MTLEELKSKAADLGFTRIQRDEVGAQIVALKDWNGFSPHGGAPGMSAAVTYSIEGYRVRVRKTLDGEYWYILSYPEDREEEN